MVNTGIIKTLLVACALVAALAPATVQGLEEIKCGDGLWVVAKHCELVGASSNRTNNKCDAVVAEFNRLPGGNSLECDSRAWCDGDYLGSGSSSLCSAAAAVWNKFPNISGVDCVRRDNGWVNRTGCTNTGCTKATIYILRVRNNCDAMAVKMNELLENAAPCNAVGEFQPNGTCTCTDPAAVGPACEFSNAKTCSDAGIAQADGSCVCTDPAVGTGPTCVEHTNAKTCSDAGIAQADGSCVCNGPATGLGLTCKEYTSSKTCNGNGDLQADKSCVCTDPAVGTGPTCVEHTNAKTCSDAGIAQADGSCVCTDPAVGVGLSCEYNNAKTCSGAGTTDASGQCTCTSPITGLGPTCSQFSNLKSCNGQATVKPDGTCPTKCNTDGYVGTRCDECVADNTFDYIEDGTVSRVAACTDLTNPTTCSTPTTVPLVKCLRKGDTAECGLGELSVDGQCELCEANTYADGTRTDGSNDNKIRVQCKPCPTGTITLQRGSSSLNQCLAQCNLGEYSSNSVCTACSTFDDNAFADGTDASGAPDNGRRASCKICPTGSSNQQLERSTTINECVCANTAETGSYFYMSAAEQKCVPCPPGEISEQGATKQLDCFAKYQKVEDGQKQCYGTGNDTRSTSTTEFADEATFALSLVGAGDAEPWKACWDAKNLSFSGTDFKFVKPADLACDGGRSASAAECKAAMGSVAASTFCAADFAAGNKIGIGTELGYPRHLCRDSTCAGPLGVCWDPEKRSNAASKDLPFGCVLATSNSTGTNQLYYFSQEHAIRFYNGFLFEPVCERAVCPTIGDKPVPLEKDDIELNRLAVPVCRLSSRGIEDKMNAATKLNNKTFLPIAIVLSFVCMFIAAVITKDELKWQWIIFGVGLRTFDMQTDWGFYSISLWDEGFQAYAEFGDETEIGYDADELLTSKQLATMRQTCLAFCIIGTLMTPFDILGNLHRTDTDGAHSFAMLVSILILAFEDIPQLSLNIKYIGIMGAGDPISVLSLIASIINIIYNVGLLIVEFSKGESPLHSFKLDLKDSFA